MPAAVKTLHEFSDLCKRPNATELRVKRLPETGSNHVYIKLKLRTSKRLYTLRMKNTGLAIKFANQVKKLNKNVRVRFFKK